MNLHLVAFKTVAPNPSAPHPLRGSQNRENFDRVDISFEGFSVHCATWPQMRAKLLRCSNLTLRKGRVPAAVSVGGGVQVMVSASCMTLTLGPPVPKGCASTTSLRESLVFRENLLHAHTHTHDPESVAHPSVPQSPRSELRATSGLLAQP